jgi:hypothetical protein
MRTAAAVSILLFVSMNLVAGEGRVRRMHEPISGQYLVMLQNVKNRDVPAAAAALAQHFGGHVDNVFQAASTGFAISMFDAEARALAHNPLVRFIEEVAVVHLSSEQPAPGSPNPPPAPYHLDHLDSHNDRKYVFCEKRPESLLTL